MVIKRQLSWKKKGPEAYDFNQQYAAHFVTIAAYAEYYGCLDALALIVMKLLMDVPCFWSAVALEPVYYFRLAIKLRNEMLYTDALRHMIARRTICAPSSSLLQSWTSG